MKRYAGLIYSTIFLLVLSFTTFSLLSSRKTTPEPIDSESSVLGEVTEIPTETIIPTTEMPTPLESVLPTEEPTTIPTPTNTSRPITTQPPQTPTPTQAAPLISQTPKLINSTAGSITTLEFGKLEKSTLYKVDLSEYNGESMVISWPNSVKINWSTASEVTKDKLSPLPTDDSEENETLYFSGLLPIPQTKIFYVYPYEDVEKISVSVVLPSTDSGSFSVQASTGIYNLDAGASYTSLPITTRDSWGANPGSWDSNTSADIDNMSRQIWYPVYYKVARIVIHHTASTPNSSNPAAAVRSIYLYHTYIRDWGDIGYNFLIDQNGTIYQGKMGGDGAQGYHAFGAANRISLGISLIGNFTSSQPTSAARSSLIKLLAEKAAFYGFSLKYSDGGTAKWRDSSYTVFGHRGVYIWDYDANGWDSDATACPGNAFVPQLPALVAEAEKYRQNHYTEIKQLVTDVERSFSQPHAEGTLIVRYNVPNTTDPSVIESYLPKFSGITSHTIQGNTVTIKTESMIITHPVLGDSEYLIPPMGWTGYDGEYATFTGTRPFVLNGPEDRARTLLKFFRMDPRVQAVDLRHTLTTQ